MYVHTLAYVAASRAVLLCGSLVGWLLLEYVPVPEYV
jgi:hypothetical protein